MANKLLVYSQETNAPPIPLTARIEWQADGTIKPCLYWTPDGSCYEVKHIYECTKLAHLREKSVGIRFKIRALCIETPEPYADYTHTQHETYLYLADNWFCGKNIIDERYAHAGKEFISVTLDVFSDCDYEIIYFMFKDERYRVDKTIAIEPRGSFYAGGVGIWHKVEARLINKENDEDVDPYKSIRREAALYFEINKWFLVVKRHDIK